MSQTHASSRREFLRRAPLAAAGVAAVTAAIPAAADAQLVPSSQPPKRLRAQLPRKLAGVNAVQAPWQLDPTDEWENWSLRLARRITLGLTSEEAQRARALGYSGYLEYHLNYEAIDDTVVETFVKTKWPNLALQGTELYTMDGGQVQTQLQEATLYRAAFSKRQLYQRVVEFWSDHFNIAMSKVGYLKALDDREVIRKHAMTTFPQLLKASARSAAMLVYLDQYVSRRQSPNQNYAREIMELHTLGAEGSYTQQDVAELSRILTGWTVSGRGDFAFSPSLHDFTAKTFLGTSFPAVNALNQTNPAGVDEGDRVLDMLVKHPNTARFIATKMLRWFLWYEPSKAMVDTVAGVYTSTGGDIKSMLRATLSFNHVQQAPAKFKRPFHWLASALRATNPTVTGLTGPNRLLNALGHMQFAWETPDGYPDQMEYWAGNLLPRWNASTVVANYATGEVIVEVATLQALGTADAIASAIGKRVFGGEMSDRTRAELVAYLKPAPTNATRIRETIALAMASSSFQWY